jgi:hypothetical protein
VKAGIRAEDNSVCSTPEGRVDDITRSMAAISAADSRLAYLITFATFHFQHGPRTPQLADRSLGVRRFPDSSLIGCDDLFPCEPASRFDLDFRARNPVAQKIGAANSYRAGHQPRRRRLTATVADRGRAR